jgi:hypothetical protein
MIKLVLNLCGWQAIMTIVGHSKWQSGIYNFSNEEISWYEFVLAEIGNLIV